MSRLRRPFLSDRYFFLTVNLLRGRNPLEEGDFERLALALDRDASEARVSADGLGVPARSLARHPLPALSADDRER